ncbi:hypothetical protein BDN70DRAFT_993627 [Pholiota conissans]|uniref:Uncharacterized protein n=1 Tax=Pholiota conissans TaxID=109636 RepID=A0A9P5Z2N4_9AGAR|nr:hypothetical protein BDN70DRAFT_993627 [Pholiota conissans]
MLFASHQILLLLTFIFSVGIQAVDCGVVTLYYVSRPVPSGFTTISASVEAVGTTIASAIGPGDAGMTRYEIQKIQSKLVFYESDTTVTAVETPFTYTYTMEQGATSVYASVPPFITHQSGAGTEVLYLGIQQNCSLDITQHTGQCVSVDKHPVLVSGDSTSTATTATATFSGQLIPLATLVTSDAKLSRQLMKAPVILLLGAIMTMIAI